MSPPETIMIPIDSVITICAPAIFDISKNPNLFFQKRIEEHAEYFTAMLITEFHDYKLMSRRFCDYVMTEYRMLGTDQQTKYAMTHLVLNKALALEIQKMIETCELWMSHHPTQFTRDELCLEFVRFLPKTYTRKISCQFTDGRLYYSFLKDW